MKYVLDTNILVHYLRNEPNVQRNLDNAIMRKSKLIIPKAVDYELRRGFCIYPAPGKEAYYDLLIEQCTIANFGLDTWDTAIRIYADLYAKRLTVGEIDILIAAFCLVNDGNLITNNINDFKNIDGLKIIDWTQIPQTDSGGM